MTKDNPSVRKEILSVSFAVKAKSFPEEFRYFVFKSDH